MSENKENSKNKKECLRMKNGGLGQGLHLFQILPS